MALITKVSNKSSDKLTAIVKAKELMQYTLTVTSNKKRYPSKYMSLIRRIQEVCMDIYEFLMEANRTSLNEMDVRNMLQTRAITACDKLSCYAEISLNLSLIGTDTADFWEGKIGDVKYMTIAWRSKDKER